MKRRGLGLGTFILAVLALSSCAQRAQVPNVVGSTLDDATRQLEGAGFRAAPFGDQCDVDMTLYDGRVTGQTPSAGTTVKTGSAVQLQVAFVFAGDRNVRSVCFTAPFREATGRFGAGGWIALLLWLTLQVILPFVAAADMTRRGERGFIYGLLIFFVFPVGVIVWLVMRSGKPTAAERNAMGNDWSR